MEKTIILKELVSKVISYGIDISVNAIKNADKNRKAENQNIEIRIYQVVVDALNEVTFNKFEGQDKLYEAAESILKGFKSNKTEGVKLGLKMLVLQVTDDVCKDFFRALCYEICRDENLYKEVVLTRQEQTIKDIQEGFRNNNRNHEKTHEKLNEIQNSINGLKERQDIIGNHESENSNKISIENRAEEYASKWNNNMFLNNYNKRDKNAGVNIKLKDIYLEKHLPHYAWKTVDEPLDDLKDLLNEYIVDNNNRKMLLILGLPGIGKSTLITWIMANLVEKQNNIYVYQFASDLKNINWQDGNILSEILKTLGLGYGELENKSLILDGFDEINVSSERERILSKLNQELAEMNILKRFSLIITCRENFVDELKKIECDFITLQTWDDDQIKSFCEVYGEKSASTISETKIDRILENKEVFGIPLILYMVLALDIAIEKNASLVDVYDQIFALDRSSIYDRCIENSRYGRAHRISELRIKQQIHQISQRIAFWIFENNSEKAFISSKEYEAICDNVISETSDENEDIKKDFLIGNYFKLIKHCEGMETQELHFIHRSIYEYFVVVYFFESICKMKSKEEVAGKLEKLLKYGRLSEQILEFIKYKFNSMKEHNLSDITKEIFNKMLRDGMTYHMGVPCKNIIEREINIFLNMLKVVGLWNSSLREIDRKIIIYLQYNREEQLNLRGLQLGVKNVDMERTDLRGTYLRGADLREANLRVQLINVNRKM